MSLIFSGCSKLCSLPDISKWNINNDADMRGMFQNCSQLSSIPDISNWNTNKIEDMRYEGYVSKLFSIIFDSRYIKLEYK